MHRRTPGTEFCGLIDRFYLLEGKDHPGQCHEILPKSIYRLVFIQNDPDGDLYFLGPNMKMRVTPMKDFFVVNFRTGIMPRLLDIKPSEMTEQTISLGTLLGTETATLAEHLDAAQGIDEKQAFIEDFFRASGLRQAPGHSLSAHAAELIAKSGGCIRVAALAERLGASVRTIERLFHQDIGMPPKQFIRLIRFQNALDKLRVNGSGLNLADLACDCGYADQSHLAKEFNSFSQRPPSRI